jgi:maleamate amidohydrolase
VRPALCIVDFVNGFTDPTVFGGGNIKPAVTNTIGLLAVARRRTLPIAFSRVVFAKDGSDDCVFIHKVPALANLTENAFIGQIVPELPPLANETILRKTQPSAFFGTGYADLLRRQGIDTVIVAGCTTSGCVRATVVDAMSHNFRTIVARDCVGDRSLAAHDANLFDMEQKYADLVESETIIATLDAIASAA